ncbi:hypothetical protein [Nocardia stercoris]|uniref:DUF11 domain-containing protein n=1 Tax=Nocardia stercoris TaxID=2483361 RepID=A0A3M2L8S1_9NOCA|nr:hypothetical protein [Nocardia stercoris]RMI33446.1 hypothetical protein EBN03_09910 [Nocardia stercoris]
MRISTKAAANIASTALFVSAAAVTLGATTADAATTCNQTSTATKQDVSTLGVTMNYSKTVQSASIGVGTTVEYTIVVGTTGIGNPYVNQIVDYPPAGFGAPTSAKVTAFHVGGGQVTENVTPTVSGAGWAVNSTGWFVNSGNPVTLVIDYTLPMNTVASDVTSGGISVGGTAGVGTSLPGLTSCFGARINNPGEAITGSANAGGFGSGTNGLSSTGSVSDQIIQIIKTSLS